MRVSFVRPLSLTVAVVALASVSAATTVASAQQGERQTIPLDRRNMDTTCAACRNFYQFANGGWMAHNPIPAAYPQWGSFNELHDRNIEALRGILDEAAARRGTAKDPTMRKLGNFYASCMDTVAIERAGAAPLTPELRHIAALATPADVRAYLIATHARGLNLVFPFGSIQDARNSSEVIGAVQEGGLGLPDRDYYFKTDSASVTLRTAYVKHVANMLALSGEPRARADGDARRVLALETALAGATLTRVERRDPVRVYNRKTPAQLAALTPGFDWKRYFAAQHIPGIAAITVESPAFIHAADSLMSVAPVQSWRAYFRWHIVREAAPTLPKAFVDEAFSFNRLLTGTPEQLPRYKRCISATDNALGEALGKAYVARYFTPTAKARALEMVNNLMAAFRERLATRTWMSDSTRAQAYAKLNAILKKVGYPDTWKDYSAMAIHPGNGYYRNGWAVLDFANRDDLKRIGKPVDRMRWGMTTPTVNASYDPSMNEIVFPAGILQPPFFDPNADDAVNYGGMGAVIGHELTHGFDDEGAQYDAKGNLRQWFTDADLKSFRGRTEVVAKQFDGYTVLDSVHVNGKLTEGENIADFGGVIIAYTAFERTLQGKPRPSLIDGFTPEQRFFLAWAQIWRNNVRPEMMRLWVNTDPHSPQIWRTNGPLSNLPEFARAWGCKPGDPMVRPAAERADIW